MTYDNFVRQSAIYPKHLGISYTALGLAEESGEVCGKIKKIYRDKNGEFSSEDKLAIRKELGDVLWYLTASAHEIGFTLEDIIEENINKISNRFKNNTVHGEGDNR